MGRERQSDRVIDCFTVRGGGREREREIDFGPNFVMVQLNKIAEKDITNSFRKQSKNKYSAEPPYFSLGACFFAVAPLVNAIKVLQACIYK